MALDLFSAVKGSLFHGDAINIDNLVRFLGDNDTTMTLCYVSIFLSKEGFSQRNVGAIEILFLLKPNSPNPPFFCLSYGLVLPYLWTSYNQKVSAILQRWHSLQIQCNYVGASRLEYGNDFFSLVLWFDFGIGGKYQDLSKNCRGL